jgi:fibronectin type 3 domain-containing protein
MKRLIGRIGILATLALCLLGAGAAQAVPPRISLSWDASAESDFSYYNVYRAASQGGPYTKVNAAHVTTNSYIDSGLAYSTTYWYVVTAVDTAENESVYSSPVSATTYSNLPEITFSALSPADLTTRTSPVTFSGTVSSPHGIQSASLWGNWSGVWQQEASQTYQALSTETLKNAGFEAFTGGLANDWLVSADPAAVYTTASDAGCTSQSQRLNITAAGAWGLYYYQTPPLQLGASYKWTLWYETSGSTGIAAEVCNASYSQVAFHQALAGTDGAWKRVELSFTYNNAEANLVRVSTTAAHTVWLDDWSLRAVDPAGTYPTKVYPSFSASMPYGTHVWAFRAGNANGNSSTSSQTLQIPDTVPPAVPLGLAATAGDKQVSLDWSDNGEPDLNRYDVYRATVHSGPYAKINVGPVTASAYTDTGLTNGTAYYYTVKAVDNASNASGYSTEASATPADTTAPAAPGGLVAQAGDKQVVLLWTDNAEPDFSHYDVFRATTPGGPYTKINASALTVSTFTNTGLTNGTTYYYVVKALDESSNASGYSAEAAVMPADTTPPAAPTGITAQAGDKQVSLVWTANAETDLDRYDVYRSTTPGGPYVKINVAPVLAPNYTDTSVTNNTAYYYAIKAVDKASNAASYSLEAAATPRDSTPPAAPGNLKATALP